MEGINTGEFWIAERLNISDWNSPPVIVKKPLLITSPERKKAERKSRSSKNENQAGTKQAI